MLAKKISRGEDFDKMFTRIQPDYVFLSEFLKLV
jgi:hypothetical protein